MLTTTPTHRHEYRTDLADWWCQDCETVTDYCQALNPFSEAAPAPSTDNDMRVWIGCLACYNAGDLVGDWFAADEAGAVTIEMVHSADALAGMPGRSADLEAHEELWVMDHEGLPVSGEMSPHEAQAWADLLGEVDDDERPAFAAYIDALGYNDPANVSADDFREAYNGEWGSREDFAQDLAESLGAIPTDYSWPASYIDWERATRDLFMDYTDAPAPGGRIYVFRSI